MQLDTGRYELILSLAEVAAIPYPPRRSCDRQTLFQRLDFNVLLCNPSGSRFLFLHRWRWGGGPFHTRMLTANVDGSAVRVVGRTSRLIWRDDDTILA